MLREALAKLPGPLPHGLYQLVHDHDGWRVEVQPDPDPRQSVIDFDQEGAQDYVADEMERLAAGDIDVAWLQRRGTYQAAIIPAENYHPPGRCCCKNCPWDGDHTGGGHGQGT